ncbi:MAG TPA: hypothetical protein VNS59_05210, partial [Lysobacter sp.]|nr:hypothetical protein [Lysobacter sp.]
MVVRNRPALPGGRRPGSRLHVLTPNSSIDPEGSRMRRRPLVLALAFVLSPIAVHAEDLLQPYELARAGDPQFSAAES